MKRLIIIISILISLGLTAQETTNNSKTATEQITNGNDEFTVKVNGLGCAFCAYGLEKKFKDLKGISDITIDLETGIFKFNYKATKMLKLTEVKQQVEEAGYTYVEGDVNRVNGNVEAAEETIEEVDSDLTFKAIKVNGNCGMCKATIEKASKLEGVETAVWDIDTKVLILEFNKSIQKLTAIEKAIANVGYATVRFDADNEAYESLPACCKYKE